MQTPIRERAKEKFRCTHCAGSGRVMMGALTSAICQTCDGFGVRRLKLDEIVAFAVSECGSVIEQCCNSSERAAESITKMVDIWLEKMNLPTSNKEGKQLFTQTVQDLIESAIRSSVQGQAQTQ